MASGNGAVDEPLTRWQRSAIKRLGKQARKGTGEPLTSDDWASYFEFAAQPSNRAFKSVLRHLPSSPRCGYCGAPFGGFGGGLVRPLGYRPSRKNPNICALCVELAPPGGMTTDVGVLFADVRGFTSHSEERSPEEVSALLRRFYSCAERVLFPKALIDKVIGDEVMALYIPALVCGLHDRPHTADDDLEARREIAKLMLAHARALLREVGYGSADGPIFEVGIGLDHGQAFIGNIGDGAVHDFTAVGDVVNTASRLQGAAAGGEIVLSARLAALLPELPGTAEQLDLKGKAEPVAARRLGWDTPVGGAR